MLVAIGLLGSQAGHLLTYQLRFGASAAQIQSSGSHAYFLSLAKTGVGAGAAILLGGLLIIALAKLLSGRALKRETAAPAYLTLLAGLYTIQLAFFTGQETVESAVAGAPASSAAVLLLWGTLGQLPVAAISAVALRWLLCDFEAAVIELRTVIGSADARPIAVAAVASVRLAAAENLILHSVRDFSLSRRGPPSLLRLR